MLEAVCFDLDGTLIDSTDAIVGSFLHVFEALNKPLPSRRDVVNTISVPLEKQFGLLGIAKPDDACRIYREHYNREAPNRTSLLPGARDSLERLTATGLRLGIATSKRRSSAEPLLEHLGVAGYFESCIGPEDVNYAKPHPEPLLLSLQRLRIYRESMIYVGDSDLDVRAAHAAGIRCLCVTDRKSVV